MAPSTWWKWPSTEENRISECQINVQIQHLDIGFFQHSVTFYILICLGHVDVDHKLSCILGIDAGKWLFCALILTRIDYCNSACWSVWLLWCHCSEYFMQPCGLSWTCGHGTMLQLHCRHYTGCQCISVLHISCAYWCMVLPSVMLLLNY